MSSNDRVTPPADLSQDSLATYEKLVRPVSEGETAGPSVFKTQTLQISINEDASAQASASPTRATPGGEGTASRETAPPVAPAYHLIGMIGRGGMGEVWEAIQYSLGRTVAVKRIKARRDEMAPSALDSAVRSFREEAFFSAQLEHPNIVPIHDLGVDEDGSPLLAMKLIEGSEWSEVIKTDFASLSVEEFLGKHIPILMSVAQAVAFAHSKGIVHRDLKPQQVMLGGFGEVLLADWGLAIKLEKEKSSESPLPFALPLILPGPHTASSPSGTPAFMAPEQTLPSARGVGTWTDVFLLGGTLYLLLTGEPPHEGNNAHAVFLNANEGRIRTPAERVAGSRTVPAELESLCFDCLKRSPGERLSSALEFVERLKDYQTGAGRRRESIALAAEVTEKLGKGGMDYRGFSDCLSKLDHARALWADNPEVVGLRGRALEGHARLALSGGDLRLARLQAEAMRLDHPKRAGVLAEIDAAEAQVLAQARQRKLAVGAVFVLLAALLVSAIIFTRKVSEERDIAEERREEAEAARQLALEREEQVRVARSDSEEMLGFVIGDLRTSLMELDRLDLLNDAAERALAHYRRQPFESLNGEERLLVLRGFSTLADIFRDQSRFDLSVEAVKEGLSWIERAYAADASTKPNRTWGLGELELRILWNDLISRTEGGDRGTSDALELTKIATEYERIGHITPLETASAHYAAARALDRTGRSAEALKSVETGMELIEQATALGELDEERAIHVKRGLISRRAYVEFGLSDYDACWKSANDLIALGQLIIEKDPDTNVGYGDMADGYGLLSTVCTIREQIDEAIKYAEMSVDAQTKALSISPLARAMRSNLGLAYLNLTRRLERAGRYEQALESSNRGIEIYERLIQESDQDTVVLGNASSTYGTRSEVFMGLKDPTSAIAAMRRSAELLDMSAKLQPDLPIDVLNLSAVRTTLANALMGANRDEEALDELLRAVEVIAGGIEDDPDNVELWRRKAESLAFLSMAYVKLQRDKEADPALREAIDLSDRYLEMKPGAEHVARLKRAVETSYRNVLLKLGRKAEALELARGTGEEAYEVYLTRPGYLLYFTTYLNAALTEWSAFDFAGDGAGALDVVRAAALRLGEFRRDYPDHDVDEYRYRTAQILARAECYDLGNLATAKEVALHAYNDIKATNYQPHTPLMRSDVLNLHYLLGFISGQEQRHEDAMQYLNEAVQLAESVVAKNIEDPSAAPDIGAWNDYAFSMTIRATYLGVVGRFSEAAGELRKALDILDQAEVAAPVGKAVFIRTRVDVLMTALGVLDTPAIPEVFPELHDEVTSTLLTFDTMEQFDEAAREGIRVRFTRGVLPHHMANGDYAAILGATRELEPLSTYIGDGASSSPAIGLRLYLNRYDALKATGQADEAAALEKDVRALYEAERARESKRDFDVLVLCEAALAFGDRATAEQDFRGAMTRVTRTRLLIDLGARNGWLSPEDLTYYRVRGHDTSE